MTRNRFSVLRFRDPGLTSGKLHEQITQDTIGSAMAVLNELRPGLDERLYENALVIELQARGHSVEQQREFPVYYRGHFIGKLVPDLIVDSRVLVDPKVVTAFAETHVAQMLGYLNISGLNVGLVLNFKNSKLEWKRVINEKRSGTVAGVTRPSELKESVESASSAVKNPGSHQRCSA